MAAQRRAAAHALLRLGRLDAAVADPARRDVRLDRRPRRCVDRLWPNALAALDWIDRYGDRDGDGFVEYERRSERGLLNQGWKDSSDAIRDRTGDDGHGADRAGRGPGLRLRRASVRMARLARSAATTALATRLEARGRRRSAQRFEAAFWIEDQRVLRDGARRRQAPADAISSNAGPVPVERDRRRRTRARASSSGCSARRCSPAGASARTPPDQPGYNPIGYHTGTVWPHDTSLIAAGLKRYGFDDEANRLVGRAARGGPALPRLPAARAVLRLRPRRRRASRCRIRSPARRRRGRPASTFLFLDDDARPRGPRGSAASWSCAHPHLPDWLGKRDAHEPARRRGVGRPAVPSLARHDQRRGAAQGRRRRRHDPALMRVPPMTHGRRAAPRGDRAAAASRLRDRRGSTPSCCSATPSASTGPAILAHPDAPVGADAEATLPGRRSSGARPASRSPTSAASRSSTASRSRSTRGR